MTLLLTALGVLLNVLALRDIFRTLFAPTGTGAMSSFAARHVWRLFRQLERRRPTALALAGPLTLLCIIGLTHVAETFLDAPEEQVEAILVAYAADHAHLVSRAVRDAEVVGEVNAEQ